MVLGNNQDGISITSLGGNSDTESSQSRNSLSDALPEVKFENSILGRHIDRQDNGIDASEVDLRGPPNTGNSDSIYQDNSGSNNGGNNSGNNGGIPSFDTGEALNMGLPEFNAESLKDNFEQNTQNVQENINTAINDLTGEGKGLNLPGVGLQDLFGQNMQNAQENISNGWEELTGPGLNLPGLGFQELKNMFPTNVGGNKNGIGLVTKIGLLAILALSIPKVIEAMDK